MEVQKQFSLVFSEHVPTSEGQKLEYYAFQFHGSTTLHEVKQAIKQRLINHLNKKDLEEFKIYAHLSENKQY